MELVSNIAINPFAAFAHRARANPRVNSDTAQRTWNARRKRGSDAFKSGLDCEQRACDLLDDDGWTIIERRARTKWGEIDVIARRGSKVCFCEVKGATRLPDGSWDELAARVDAPTQHRLRRAAIAWIAMHARELRGVDRFRFDVVLVAHAANGRAIDIERIVDAF